MNRLAKYQAQRAETLTQMKAILDAAETNEDGRLSGEQETAYAALKARRETLDASIAREQELIEAERTAPAIKRVEGEGVRGVVGRVGAPAADQDPRRGFRTHTEFLLATMQAAQATSVETIEDERLRPLAVRDREERGSSLVFMLPRGFTPRGLSADAGSDEHGVYSDPHGGYSVAPTLLPGMLSVGPEGDPSAGRTRAVPMQSPVVHILARTDKDHTTSVAGGLTVTRRPETASIAASRMAMEMVELKATGQFGLSFATEEILSDSPLSFASIIAAGMRDQFAHAKFAEILRGGGGNEYLGILNDAAAATVTVNKETGQAADTVVLDNVLKMRSRCWGYGRAIWLANHDAYPQLAKLALPVGTGGTAVYQQSVAEDRPDMLLGRPIFYSEYCSTVGDKGDLILAVFSEYLDGLYQPLQSAESMHVRFINHERAFKFWQRNAGAPWWRAALTPHKGSNTLSPFVTLAARA